MMKSMTAFGRAKSLTDGVGISVEFKSVNSRFFDCTVKLPRSYLFLEEKIKGYIRNNAVSRAKVDVFIGVTDRSAEKGIPTVDEEYTRGYLDALRTLRDTFGLADDISVMSVAKNPDVFTSERREADLDAAWEGLRPVLDEAIAGYVQMRTAEGERIFADLCEKVESIRKKTYEIAEISRTDTVGYRDKLEARLRAILADESVTVDESRLLTECAVWADKIAIDEELVRLRSHFDAFYEIAKLPEPSGRKLDFLIQEMNRETNTIGSKANNVAITRLVVDIKGEIEKIREQVQNIE